MAKNKNIIKSGEYTITDVHTSNNLTIGSKSTITSIVVPDPTNLVKYAKLRQDAILPTRDIENAGSDVYACFDEPYMVINPHETKLIPTGIASAFHSDFVALLKERGSTGTKGLGQRAGVIDSGYRGEWFVPITNHNEKTIVIVKKGKIIECGEFLLVDVDVIGRKSDIILYPYEKAISQVIFALVPRMQTEEITYEELQKIDSKRGTGMLGSSGK